MKCLLLPIGLALLAVFLRFYDLGALDLVTDEAQFALGSSAAQPPLGMWLFSLTQQIFGSTELVIRLTTAVSGLLTVLGIGCLWWLIRSHREQIPTARYRLLWIIAVASMCSAHIIFSRYAYLSSPLALAWIICAIAWVLASQRTSNARLVALCITIIACTLIKTQGGLLPGLLLLGRIVERRERSVQDPLVQVTIIALLPICAHILTHPEIIASFLIVQDTPLSLFERITTMPEAWWFVGVPWLLSMILCWRYLISLPWVIWCLLSLSFLQAILLQPRPYYSLELVFWAMPIGLWLSHQRAWWQWTFACLFALQSTYTVFHDWQNPNARFWHTYTNEINQALVNESQIVALGSIGHQVRWYLEPEVLVGNRMQLETWTGSLLAIGNISSYNLSDWQIVQTWTGASLWRPITIK